MRAHALYPWLCLAFAPGMSDLTKQRLLAHFGDIEKLTNASGNTLHELGIPTRAIQALHQPNTRWIEQTLQWQQAAWQHVISFTDPQYPALLKQMADAPIVLYVKGQLQALAQQQIAIVGSRNPSHVGRETAFWLAHQLSEAGLIITSGMAIGIDGAAHQGALQAKGSTIAVLAHGLWHIYPRRHQALANDIAQQGALLSEFPLWQKPLPRLFPQRNRIISGLSLGTVVVEATERSGSLITAHCAVEQGREVFAVPGSIRNPQSRGCHSLIQSGAKLVQNSADILQELVSICPDWQPKIEKLSLDPNSTATTLAPDQLLSCIDFEPTPFDIIAQRSQLSRAALSSRLLRLEISGYIKNEASSYRRIR